MALVLGTNCGFCSVAPTTNPYNGNAVADNYARAIKDASPSGSYHITEIGWYCSTASDDLNFEVGLYSDEGNGEPEERLEVNTTNAKGTTVGWKKVTGLNWSLSSETNYWIAISVENETPGDTYTRYAASGGSGYSRLSSTENLPADWGSGTNDSDGMIAVYAVYEEDASGETYDLSLNESLSLSDSLSILISHLSLIYGKEIITFNDSIEAKKPPTTYGLYGTDFISFSDDISKGLIFNRYFSETLNLNDSINRGGILNKYFTDSINLQDVVNALIKVTASHSINLSDIINFNDSFFGNTFVIRKPSMLMFGGRFAKMRKDKIFGLK